VAQIDAYRQAGRLDQSADVRGSIVVRAGRRTLLQSPKGALPPPVLRSAAPSRIATPKSWFTRCWARVDGMLRGLSTLCGARKCVSLRACCPVCCCSLVYLAAQMCHACAVDAFMIGKFSVSCAAYCSPPPAKCTLLLTGKGLVGTLPDLFDRLSCASRLEDMYRLRYPPRGAAARHRLRRANGLCCRARAGGRVCGARAARACVAVHAVSPPEPWRSINAMRGSADSSTTDTMRQAPCNMIHAA
jgi:hypothetical protein